MIVPPRKESWLTMIFHLHGTIILRIKYRLLIIVLLSVAITFVHQNYYQMETLLSPRPFSLIGLALGIFLGFRNNTSYDRFWEGRILWGGLVNYARTMARRIDNFIEVDGTEKTKKSLTYQTIAYIHCLRMHLRDEWEPEQIQNLLSEEQIKTLKMCQR